jgi:hypothetical protein
VVEDGNVITSRKPDDILAFSKEVIELTANRPQREHFHGLLRLSS